MGGLRDTSKSIARITRSRRKFGRHLNKAYEALHRFPPRASMSRHFGTMYERQALAMAASEHSSSLLALALEGNTLSFDLVFTATGETCPFATDLDQSRSHFFLLFLV